MRSFVNIDAFIPPQFEAHRLMIVESFERFVAQLSPARQAELLASQQALPADCTHERRLVACLRCCPTLHKLGQILARDKRLDAALRDALQHLEVLASSTSLGAIEPVVKAELGAALSEFDIRLGAHALAEGSVAVAWPVSWMSHRDRQERQRAVLKIPHPNIRERVAEEVNVLRDVAEHVERHAKRFGVSALDCREAMEDACRLLEREVDVRGEQSNLDLAARQYANDPNVAIPELTPYCTENITAMSHLEGRKITELTDATPIERQRLAEQIVESLLSNVVFARDADTLIHGDPHAGNLMRMQDGRLGLIDWGLAAALSGAQRTALSKIFVAGITFDAPLLAANLASLASRRPDESVLRRVADAALSDVSPASPPGLTWLTRTLDRASLSGIQFPGNALLFRKSLHTLIGVVEDVSPDVSMDQVMWTRGAAAFAGDLLSRGFAPPTGSAFAIRLSNADMLRAWWSLPLAPMRYWQRAMEQAFGDVNR